MTKDVEKFKTSVNDVTGDLIKSKASSQKAYADNWERIFGKKTEEHPHNNSGFRFSGMALPESIAVFEEGHIATPFMEEQSEGIISSKDARIVLETPDGDVECVPYVQEFVEGLLPQGMIENEQ